MTTFATFVGTWTLYLGGVIILCLLVIAACMLITKAVGWFLRMLICVNETWESFLAFRAWYNSPAGADARANRKQHPRWFHRLGKWMDK